MSPLPPVAAAVPGTQRRPPRWQAPQQQQQQQQQQAGDRAAPAATGVTPPAGVATPGGAAAEAAAAVLAGPTATGAFSGGVPLQPLHSPFAASPEPLARKLDAEFGAAASGECVPEPAPQSCAAQQLLLLLRPPIHAVCCSTHASTRCSAPSQAARCRRQLAGAAAKGASSPAACAPCCTPQRRCLVRCRAASAACRPEAREFNRNQDPSVLSSPWGYKDGKSVGRSTECRLAHFAGNAAATVQQYIGAAYAYQFRRWKRTHCRTFFSRSGMVLESMYSVHHCYCLRHFRSFDAALSQHLMLFAQSVWFRQLLMRLQRSQDSFQGVWFVMRLSTSSVVGSWWRIGFRVHNRQGHNWQFCSICSFGDYTDDTLCWVCFISG